jgi:hypothetical protein
VLAVPGQPIEVEIQLPLACDERVNITQGLVMVTDPAGAAVAPDSVPTFDRGPAFAQTVVKFTPHGLGTYLASAGFEPNLGTVVRAVMVATDHSAEPPAFVLDPTSAPSGCVHLDITPRARLLCTATFGPVTLYEADGGVLQTIDAQSAALKGSTLWTDDMQGQLARWVETELEDGGDAFVQSPDASVHFGTNAWLYPTDTGVVAFTGVGTLAVVTQADGGLTADYPHGQFGPGGFQETWAVGWSDGTNLLTEGGQVVDDFSIASGYQDGAGPPGSAIAMDRFGVWHADPALNTPPFASNQLWLIHSPVYPIPTMAVPNLHAYSPSQIQWETGVALESDTLRFVASYDGSGFNVEAYPPTDAGIAGITGTSVMLRTSGAVQLYRRALMTP